MRTVPSRLEKFRQMVNERGAHLRQVPFSQLKDSSGFEKLTVDSRPAMIATIILPLPASGGIQVIVQGFMETRLIGKHVALDGFYKYPDDTVAANALLATTTFLSGPAGRGIGASFSSDR